MKTIPVKFAREYKFVVTVRGATSMRAAHTAILSAFAQRNPDYCEFNLKQYRRNRPAHATK